MTGVADVGLPGLVARLWIYQTERFPLVRSVPLLLAFSASSVTASAHLAGRSVPGAAAYATAFILVLVFFWQMRVADEVKDAETDQRYRPERPIPRGLVSLRLIVWLGVLSTFIALAAALAFHPLLTLLVFAVWEEGAGRSPGRRRRGRGNLADRQGRLRDTRSPGRRRAHGGQGASDRPTVPARRIPQGASARRRVGVWSGRQRALPPPGSPDHQSPPADLDAGVPAHGARQL